MKLLLVNLLLLCGVGFSLAGAKPAAFSKHPIRASHFMPLVGAKLRLLNVTKPFPAVSLADQPGVEDCSKKAHARIYIYADVYDLPICTTEHSLVNTYSYIQ